MNKILIVFNWITVISMMMIVIILGVWEFYPFKVIEFKKDDKGEILPFKVENKIVKKGGKLVYIVNYCKYTNIIPISTRHFVDGLSYDLSTNISTKKPKGCRTNIVNVNIPHSLPTGTYFIEITYRYKLNPIRSIDITVRTETFTVIDN